MSSLVKVEIFWDGDGWYFAHPYSSQRLGGPNINLHALWREADSQGYEVIGCARTRATRNYRQTRLTDSTKQQEKAFEKYVENAKERAKTHSRKQAMSKVPSEEEDAGRLSDM